MSNLDDFQFLEKIGEGSFSSVHKVRNRKDGIEYALKKVKLGNLKEKEKENALNEVRILASIDHSNIISYKNAFFDEKSNSLCIIMEYAQEGDLQRQIDSAMKKKQYISEDYIWNVISHSLRGLQTLHNLKILHRDMKCANIFICKNNIFKLGDLNVSKVAKRGLLYTQTGTPYYASPEVWRDEPYDIKSDIWSFGCIIYEMCRLKPPFRAKDMEGLFQKVQKGIYDRIPRNYSDDIAKIISLCLNVNSKTRPSATELLNHPLLLLNCGKMQLSPEQIQKQKDDSERNQNLLQTIRVPMNMKSLSTHLPQNKYDLKDLNNSVVLGLNNAEYKKKQKVQSLNLNIKKDLNYVQQNLLHIDRQLNNQLLLPLIKLRNNNINSRELKRELSLHQKNNVKQTPQLKMYKDNHMFEKEYREKLSAKEQYLLKKSEISVPLPKMDKFEYIIALERDKQKKLLHL